MPSFFSRKKLGTVVPPSRMTIEELVTWSNASTDEKQYAFRRGFSRHTLCARAKLAPELAAEQLAAAGAGATWKGIEV